MKLSMLSKVIVLVVTGLCASCSSPGQSVQKTPEVDVMSKQALSVGIESGEARLVTFYIANNTSADIRMLKWNTPFEKALSVDMFLVTRGDEKMAYLGRKVKRSNPAAGDYLVVPTGKKLESAMDIAEYYGMSEPGEYTVTINLPEIDGVTKLNQETPVAIESGTLNIEIGQ